VNSEFVVRGPDKQQEASSSRNRDTTLPHLRITVGRLLFAVAISAVLMGTAVIHLRSRMASNMSIPGATAVLRGAEGDLRALTFSEDGSVLLAAGRQGSIQIWDSKAGWPLASMPGSRSESYAIAISPDRVGHRGTPGNSALRN
jgi:hypothetical protein